MEVIQTPKPDIGWSIIELVGGRQLLGYLSEETRFGVAFCRVDLPETEEHPARTEYYKQSAIYSIRTTTEQHAIK